jgi:hypothetical protein
MKNIVFLSILIASAVFYSNTAKTQIKSDNSIQNFIKGAENIDIADNSKLIDGIVFVEFPQKLREDLIGQKYIINLTALGSWSGLYIKEINDNGFIVKSESGDLNVKFFWKISSINSYKDKQ